MGLLSSLTMAGSHSSRDRRKGTNAAPHKAGPGQRWRPADTDQPSLTVVPAEVVRQTVLKFLTEKDLWKARGVSHLFYSSYFLADQRFEDSVSQEEIDESCLRTARLLERGRKFPRLTQMAIQIVKHKNLDFINPALIPKLESLVLEVHIEKDEPLPDVFPPPPKLTHHPNVKRLIVNGFFPGPPAWFDAYPNLKSFELRDLPIRDDIHHHPDKISVPTAELEELALTNLDIFADDYERIAAHKKLTSLRLHHVNGADMLDFTLPAPEFTELQKLDLHGCTNLLFSHLPYPKLEALDLSASNQTAVGWLCEQKRDDDPDHVPVYPRDLSILYLDYNPTLQLNTLPDFPKLTLIDLASCNIKNLDTLHRFQALEEVFLDENKGLDLSTLPDLPKVKKLDLGGCNIKDARFLSRCPLLEDLALDNNPPPDPREDGSSSSKGARAKAPPPLLRPLMCTIPHLEHLKLLGLDGCDIVDLSPLSRFPTLKELSVRQNKRIDLATLPKHTLPSLNIGACKFDEKTDLSHLGRDKLPELEVLILDQCPSLNVESLLPLSAKIKTIYLDEHVDVASLLPSSLRVLREPIHDEMDKGRPCVPPAGGPPQGFVQALLLQAIHGQNHAVLLQEEQADLHAQD